MRRFIIPALLCLALPGLAAAQTAAGNPAGPPPTQQTAPATPDTDAGPTDAPMHGKHAAMMQKVAPAIRRRQHQPRRPPNLGAGPGRPAPPGNR